MSAAPHASRQVPAPKDRAKIISAIKKLVPERHINVSNPNQDYRPWIALVDQRMPRLIELDDAQAFESGVGELLRALGSSHTAFFHQRRDSVPAPYSINATLRAVETPQGKRWSPAMYQFAHHDEYKKTDPCPPFRFDQEGRVIDSTNSKQGDRLKKGRGQEHYAVAEK